MTERLYYTDSYLQHMDACVTGRSDDGLRVALNQTVFYPTSGGQPNDVGRLNGIEVVDVIDNDDTIVHVMASPLPGQDVHGEIAWARRYDHMQQHTGQHLLSAVFEELFTIPTLSFRMGEASSTIELGTKGLAARDIETAVLRATELARGNALIAVTFEKAEQAQGLRKASERSGILRIVELPGIDKSACGGTHVRTLAEVLPLQIREMERVRGNVRIGFVCGNRAITKTHSDYQILSRAAKSLATSIEKVEVQVALLQQRLADTEKQKQRLVVDAATRAGADHYERTHPDENGIRRLVLTGVVMDESARALAKSFVSQPKALIVLTNAEGVLLACSPDCGFNAKDVLVQCGVRGGGSALMAQGSVGGADVLERIQKRVFG